jgi:hypothetical protein
MINCNPLQYVINDHWELVIEATQFIDVGEEILLDYGTGYLNNMGKAVHCLCDRSYKDCSGYVANEEIRRFDDFPKGVKDAPWNKNSRTETAVTDCFDFKEAHDALLSQKESAAAEAEKLKSEIENLKDRNRRLENDIKGLNMTMKRTGKKYKKWEEVLSTLTSYASDVPPVDQFGKVMDEISDDDRQMGYLFLLQGLQKGTDYVCPNCEVKHPRKNQRRHFADCNTDACHWFLAIKQDGNETVDKTVRDILQKRMKGAANASPDS